MFLTFTKFRAFITKGTFFHHNASYLIYQNYWLGDQPDWWLHPC